MIELPWQVIASLVGLVALSLVLSHLKKTNCDERVETAKRQQHRDTMASYRDSYQRGLWHGSHDQSQPKEPEDL